MKQWYETLFDNYAKGYDSESYVHGTVGEVDFIEEELEFNKTKHILEDFHEKAEVMGEFFSDKFGIIKDGFGVEDR